MSYITPGAHTHLDFDIILIEARFKVLDTRITFKHGIPPEGGECVLLDDGIIHCSRNCVF